MLAIRSVKYFILFMILLLGFGVMPGKASAMIIGPPVPPAEGSPSCDAIQAWLDENQDIGGTYVLSGDLIITDSLSIYMPEVPITIEAGPYHIYVKDTALLELIGSNITITGDGGTEGLIRTSSMGTLIFAECNITAENGTALFYEGGKPTNWSIYIGGTLNSPTFIQAFGDNARGIVCEQPDPLQLSNTFVKTDGSGSVGVSAVSDIFMSNCSVTAEGAESVSVVSQSGEVTGTLCRLTPEAPQFSDDGTQWIITEIDKLNFVLPPFTAYEESGLPNYMTVNLANSEDPYDTRYIALAVTWDRTAYDAGLEKTDPFTLTGTLETRENLLNDSNQTPMASISFKTATPIDDLSVTTTPDVKMCRLDFSFTPPTGASSVKLLKSVDGGSSWISEDITQAYSQNDVGKALYDDIMKEHGTALYRLKVTGSAYAGYSNTVTCTFEALPLTGDAPEDIDGTRGGGGRIEPDRNTDSNIFENMLEYIPSGNATISAAERFSAGDEKIASPLAKNTGNELQQNVPSSEDSITNSSQNQNNLQSVADVYSIWPALGILLILLFFIGALLWLNPVLRSRFFKK
ncbi:hypothetical protein [Eubacterium limosum]|uniref:hypothetical protein n=1 Tax=Eubacterium limosum TaxID=1736 RepID=UPI0037173864